MYTLGSGDESRPVRGARVVVALPTRNGLTVAAYGREQIIIASYFHDSAAPIEFEDLEEALTSGHRAGEVRTYARKREFDTSPLEWRCWKSSHWKSPAPSYTAHPR